MSAPGAVRALAPAKVNLWLRVLERRPDGFHELDTLFQAISLFDEVEVSPRPGSGVSLTVEGAELGPVEDNLAYRAARAFLEAAGGRASRAGVAIVLRKRIPAGAGLGGGSSDAAAVLRCMSTLWEGVLAGEALSRVGATLGSDVPFFLGDAPIARGRGRGEILLPLPPLPEGHLALVLPPVHVATGGAYAALARGREGTRGAGRDAWDGSGALTWRAVATVAVNDFEEVVPGAYPPVAASLQALRETGARPALLSGSGGACFGLLPDAPTAGAAAGELQSRLGWTAIPVRTLTSLPGAEVR